MASGTKCSCKIKTKRNPENRHPSETTRFRKLRKQILSRDGFQCQRCIKFNRHDHTTMENLEVHHIKSFRDFPELAYEPSNLITVCRYCNLDLGNSNKLDFDWEPNEEELLSL
ncbi:HNH endonuclease [Peribacillus frigoritolerans]|uniref:HNH endonuclease n=1 Tax=Peribacillus frigoritolerans TaxID=450367 RepID=UPI002416BA8D|nr:HNH endonuclease signature motif containing protein [Peribacillus frigoritolerans]MDG4850525.1 HNH endonuclease signature motif containing protein [Peribacillus frigoritolerans]